MTSKSNTEFIEKINKAYNEAWDLINTRSGWQPAKAMFLRSANLDKIEWRRRRTGGSNRKSSGIVYRVTATLPSPKEKVVALLRDVNNIASWNRTLQVWYSYIIFDILKEGLLQAVRTVKHLDKDTVITYHITSSSSNRLMFPRDFVLGVKFGTYLHSFTPLGVDIKNKIVAHLSRL